MKTNQIITNSLASLASGLILLGMPPARSADVSPRGVNVKSFGTTTVFLTYFGLNNQTPAEALWCGEINADRSCFSGTVFGRLPRRYNIGRTSGRNNYTDIMTIPASVARKAYQDAARGNNSEFFYVRRWRSNNGGPDEFVAVTCRLAGGGVAGFPMPVFRYFMTANTDKLIPIAPTPNRKIAFGEPIRFSWQGISTARGYKLEVKDKDRVILSALLSAERTTYTAPPWLKQQTNQLLTWQIRALDRDGSILTESVPQQFQITGK